MKPRADWLAWSLQFIVGLVVGALVSNWMVTRRRGPLLDPDHTGLFVLGVALVVAALASFFGDRLWMGSSSGVIPADEPEHSNRSRVCSIVAGILGAGLIVVAF